MAIYFLTSTSKKLLETFKKAIDDGDVRTWEYDDAGDFTHTASQWDREAWLRPKLEQDRLTLHILPPKKKIITPEIYGIYHGRFIESMIIHCGQLFTQGIATAKETSGDIVKGSDA
jgi:hypothetical protein